MALGSPVVTKVSVTYPQEGLYKITLNLTVPDDSAGWDGIDQTFQRIIRQETRSPLLYWFWVKQCSPLLININ